MNIIAVVKAAEQLCALGPTASGGITQACADDVVSSGAGVAER